ncbi:MAG TPA: substrate-binding domain-containing protein, partial [Pyrinomonadaceae bacterium]|nr:substrate-binding domain-containing protein [Pyrinomonadaceae bacterium]
AASGEADRARALQTLQAIWKNVFSTPASAREARTTFELGNGDALITYELDALLMKQANANADAEIVVPEATIFSEHPVVVIDRNVSSADRPVIDAFVNYLFSEETQTAFVKFNFRSSTNDALNQENKELATIKYPFTVDYFGGWDKAYPDVIEGIFRNQVQSRK